MPLARFMEASIPYLTGYILQPTEGAELAAECGSTASIPYLTGHILQHKIG